jgi:hypothetical protein
MFSAPATQPRVKVCYATRIEVLVNYTTRHVGADNLMAWVRALSALDKSRTVTNEAFASLLVDVVGPHPAMAKQLRWHCLAQRPKRHHGAIFDIANRIHANEASAAAAHYARHKGDTAAEQALADRFEDVVECVSETRVCHVALRSSWVKVVETLLVCDAVAPHIAAPATTALLRAMAPDLQSGLTGESAAAAQHLTRLAIGTGRWEAALLFALLSQRPLAESADLAGRAIARGESRSQPEQILSSTLWAGALQTAEHWLAGPSGAASGSGEQMLTAALQLVKNAVKAPSVGFPVRRWAASSLANAWRERRAAIPQPAQVEVDTALFEALRACGAWAQSLGALKTLQSCQLPVHPTLISAVIRTLGEAGRWEEAMRVRALTNDTSSPNTRDVVLASLYTLGKSGKWAEALSLADGFVRRAATAAEARPVLIAAVTALAHGVGRSDGEPQLDELIRRLRVNGGLDAGSASYAIALYANCGRLDAAVELVEDTTLVPHLGMTLLAANAVVGAVFRATSSPAVKRETLKRARVASASRLRVQDHRQLHHEGPSDRTQQFRVLAVFAAAEVSASVQSAASEAPDVDSIADACLVPCFEFIRGQRDFDTFVGAIARELRRTKETSVDLGLNLVATTLRSKSARRYHQDAVPGLLQREGFSNEQIARRFMR